MVQHRWGGWGADQAGTTSVLPQTPPGELNPIKTKYETQRVTKRTLPWRSVSTILIALFHLYHFGVILDGLLTMVKSPSGANLLSERFCLEGWMLLASELQAKSLFTEVR